jgi:ATP-binding cassette, subfamily C, bacterial CydD
VDTLQTAFQSAFQAGPSPPEAAPYGPIEVREVVIAYPGRALLGPYSLDLPMAGITALTGPCGAGKSSLIAALLGQVVPAAGQITVAGRELVPSDAWRRRVAWVPQSPFLFAGTVADNIAFAVPGAPGEAVERAADLAGVGLLDLRIGERGAGMPAADRQRIALARAALRCELLEVSLLLLDEPTEHLDPAAETDVAAILDVLARGRTALVVTSRRTLLDRADRSVSLAAEPPGPGAAGLTG